MQGEGRQKILIGFLVISVAVLAGLSYYFWYNRLDLAETNSARVRDFYAKLAAGNLGWNDSGEYLLPPEREFEAERSERINLKESFIEVDLAEMKLTLYKEGQMYKVYPVLSKGQEGSWWETPTGSYNVLSKERNHFSSIGGVWMPWSLQFYGNYFIHGWPYYEGGVDVAGTYSGGCVRLSTADAKEIYDFASTSMAVLLRDRESSRSFGKISPMAETAPPPVVSAKSYLVSDLSTGLPILRKNALDVVPIASLTKLMTGVVASELIYMERAISVRESALASAIDAFNPKVGERYIAFDLLYPLLMQSSNVAADTLASYLGKHNFVANMNTKATSLSMDDTTFADASGKLAANTSSATDIEKLLRYIYFKRQFLFDISKGKQDYRFVGRRLDKLKNFNEFVDDPNLLGIKNGETTAAGQTLAGVWEFEGTSEKVPIALVILGSEDREKDARALLEWFETNYSID